jgi:hypothetical protein
MAVTVDPSSTASGSPVSASNRATTAWIVGRPRAAFAGMKVTSFTDAPLPWSRRPGISMRSPEPIDRRWRIGE